MSDNLLTIQQRLIDGSYQPGAYRHFTIAEPKPRNISAIPFPDRVVHHALCNIIEPDIDKTFISNSFANRRGKGTHRAIDCFQHNARRYRYVLRADIQQHFASIDHEILLSLLARQLRDGSTMPLINAIVASGDGKPHEKYKMQWFDGDDLLSACRPKGLPIGNLTSQFWSNCYMNPFDHFVKRELRCRGYLRYVDDFALFSNSKQQLWEWKRQIVERLAQMRLMLHDHSCQVCPTRCGSPWLGMVIYPERRTLKARKSRHATRKLTARYRAWRAGEISYDELNASINGWVAHARHSHSGTLIKTVLDRAMTKKTVNSNRCSVFMDGGGKPHENRRRRPDCPGGC